MDQNEMKARTKAFAVRAFRLVEALPRGPGSDVIGRQLLRSATSVGANYRAVRRARSSKDFINKLGIVEEEADESAYWLELLGACGIVAPERIALLQREAEELTAIIVATIRSAKRNHG